MPQTRNCAATAASIVAALASASLPPAKSRCDCRVLGSPRRLARQVCVALQAYRYREAQRALYQATIQYNVGGSARRSGRLINLLRGEDGAAVRLRGLAAEEANRAQFNRGMDLASRSRGNYHPTCCSLCCPSASVPPTAGHGATMRRREHLPNANFRRSSQGPGSPRR